MIDEFYLGWRTGYSADPLPAQSVEEIAKGFAYVSSHVMADITDQLRV